MRLVMKQLNPEATLMKDCFAAYTAWLRRQRATAGAAAAVPPAFPLPGDGPAAGAYSHREAVDAWHRLLHCVIYHGAWFLLQVLDAFEQGCALLRLRLRPSLNLRLACFISCFAPQRPPPLPLHPYRLAGAAGDDRVVGHQGGGHAVRCQ